MCYQITQNFDEVVALACSPRPPFPIKVYFECDRSETMESAVEIYDGDRIKKDLQRSLRSSEADDPFKYSSFIDDFSYTEFLHLLVTFFPSRPLSLKF